MARSQELSGLFAHPQSTTQRHFEICRAYFLERLTAEAVAQRFGLQVNSIRTLVRDFAARPDLGQFFRTAQSVDRPSRKRESIRDCACDLRRQGHTLAEILTQLHSEGHSVSAAYLFRVLQDEGLITKGHRCRSVPQPGELAKDGSLVPEVACVQQLALSNGRQFTTKVAGLFLFLPQLLELDLPGAVRKADLPGSEQIPPLQAFLALLVPKLLGHRRISHISDLCSDEGAGLWAGLNVLPKTTYATDYSYRTDRVMHERLVAAVVAKTPLGDPPFTFNLDFHSIPFRGHDADLEKHWVPMRNRALTAVMAFVAQAAGRRIMCYATSNVLRSDADNMVPRFAEYWKEQTGQYPARLLFDSRATTYAGLNQLNKAGVGFITIRRRGSSMLARVERLSASSWQHCQIIQAKGKRRQVSYVDEYVDLDGYKGKVRQLIVTGLGHDHPTFFLTNDQPQRQTAREVIQTYASRNHVENRLGEQITFFHLDCLCSEVRLNVDFDLTLTVVADLLYRGLAERLKGFAQASPHKVFRKFVDTPGSITIKPEEIVVRLSKRAHNPVVKEAGLTQRSSVVPWLANRCVRVECP
jgi:transposase